MIVAPTLPHPSSILVVFPHSFISLGKRLEEAEAGATLLKNEVEETRYVRISTTTATTITALAPADHAQPLLFVSLTRRAHRPKLLKKSKEERQEAEELQMELSLLQAEANVLRYVGWWMGRPTGGDGGGGECFTEP